MPDNLFVLLTKVFEDAGFLGLFIVSGWLAAIALTCGVTTFFVWHIKNIQAEIKISRETWQKLIEHRDEMLIDIIDKVTTTNSQLAERINTLQMMIIQVVTNNGKNGN